MSEQSREVAVRTSADLQKSIDSFNEPLARYLKDIGLPTENALYSLDERKNVVNALEEALTILPIDERARSHYLTKFTVAIAAGLFDGALNYLWNETIAALRRLVLKFDLEYFFSIAEKISSRHKNASSEEDLNQINDHDLLETCRRIGLLSDVNYQRLEHVNYMRNHASAAHPNDHEIDAFEILAWLRVCLRHVIIAEPDHSVISVKRLLDNIRTVVIPTDDVLAIGDEITRLSQERIDDLLWTIFGMFTSPQTTVQTRNNIANLAPYVWPASSEQRKLEIGARYGVFRKNGEVVRKDATQKFLSLVKGLRYRDEDSLAGELIDKLETLKRVHFGYGNFYGEHPHARLLKSSLPVAGTVPPAARSLWVKVTSICFVGNGLGYREGVDEAAVPYYKEYISNFTEVEIVEFIYLFQDTEFSSILSRKKPDERARKLAAFLKTINTNVHVQRALDVVVNGPQSNLHKLAATADYKKALAFLPEADGLSV